MKKVNVLIKDLETLELLEDAKKGDFIDLKDLQKVDLAFIEKRVLEETNSIYKKRYENELALAKASIEERVKALENQLSLKDKEHEKELSEAKNNYDKILQKEKFDFDLKLQEQANKIREISGEEATKLRELETKLKHDFDLEREDLKAQNNLTKSNNSKELNNLENEYKLKLQNAFADYQKKFNELETKITTLENDNKHLIATKENEISLSNEKITNQYLKEIENYKAELNNKTFEIKNAVLVKEAELTKLHNEEIEVLKKNQQSILEEKNTELRDAQEELSRLINQKSSLSVKMIGEDLETWCNNEMLSYLQVGLTNCTWEKDNLVIRDEDEKKGSKADYIYKVFATDDHLPNELLASVCLDMKDEDPNSKNKQTNSHYFSALDKNRNKKNCKYAVLVSTLEMDKPNALPIYKVLEYENMYVCQPAYMMTFLNMLTSLSMKFKDVLLKDVKERLELTEVNNLIEDFESLKNTYLDKPLEKLRKELDKITTANLAIKEASKKIDVACEEIVSKYVNEIFNKLERFNIKKISRKLVNLNEE